jgi:type II secretory pathway pseudopilin PulG
MRVYRGTSIIEIVIVAALISLSVISALSLSNHSQKQNTYARDLAEATQYGSEAIDWIRAQRSQLGFATIAAQVESDGSSGIYCINSLPVTDFVDAQNGSCQGGVGGSYITGTTFQRELIIDTTSSATGLLKVTVVVTWLDKIERQTSIETELTQW